MLLVALRFLGVSDAEVGWAEVLAVFAFARLLTAIPFTPGGLGVIELALITGLSAAGGPRADVAAAVLVFRALTYVLPIPLGAVAYVFWRRNQSWRRPPGGAPRTDLVAEWVEPSPGVPAVDGPGPTWPRPGGAHPPGQLTPAPQRASPVWSRTYAATRSRGTKSSAASASACSCRSSRADPVNSYVTHPPGKR